MRQSRRINRRTVLRGLGASLALPWLDAMLPFRPLAKAGEVAKAMPNRMAFFYVPNGIHMQSWTPETVGADYKLPETLKPLESFRDDFLVLSGLTQDNAFAHGDGPGDHARAMACFLTGTHPRKTDGANLRAGISVDQLAAQRLGHKTRLPSLELGLDPSAQAGSCDSGYSCAYSSNISWSSETTPVAKEINPRLAFERLFGDDRNGASATSRAFRDHHQASILDMVADDTRRLKRQLGATDNHKLDEYLTSVRDIERRIAKASEPVDIPEGTERPTGIPKDYQEHAGLMMDLIALAFQTDVTRIASFVFANEGSNRSYPQVDVTDGHHYLSHHGNDPEKHAKLAAINLFHLEQFVGLIRRLKATPEGEGNVLDNSMIVYGSGIADGNRHNHDDLPILLFGRGHGTINPGRHVQYAHNTPLNNLYLSLLDRMGSPVSVLGDSKGRLEGLES